MLEAGDALQGGGRGQGDTAYIQDPNSPPLEAERGAMNAEGEQSRIWSRTQIALLQVTQALPQATPAPGVQLRSKAVAGQPVNVRGGAQH